MANPSFWYYPTDSSLVEIQLPGPLTEFTPIPLRDRRTAWTLAGTPMSVVHSGRMRVTITLGPFNDTGSFEHLARKLDTMSSHLERGLPVSFAVDRERCWLSSCVTTPGSTVVVYGTNTCAAYNASASFTTGDIMAIESPNPEGHREYAHVAGLALTDPEFTASEGVQYAPETQPLMLRHRDFYPVLYMPEDQLGRAIVVHDHRLLFTLDLTLEQGLDGQVALVNGTDWAEMAEGLFGDTPLLHGSGLSEDIDRLAAPGSSLQSAVAAPLGLQGFDPNDWARFRSDGGRSRDSS